MASPIDIGMNSDQLVERDPKEMLTTYSPKISG